MIDDVTIVIPHYGSATELSPLLSKFARMSVGRLIVVDNNPQPMVEMQVIAAGFDYLHCGKPGSYNARNYAITKIKSRYIYFIDSDCIIDFGHCENLRKVSAEGHDLVAGEVEILDHGRRGVAFYYDKIFSFQNDVNKRLKQATTATLLIRSELFNKIGHFDGDLRSGADIKWTKMATNSGVRLCYDGRLNVSHPPRDKISEIIMKQRRIFGGELQSRKMMLPLLLKRVLPPINKWQRIFKAKSVPFYYKILLLGLAWLINLLFIIEFCRLTLGFDAERR